MNPCDRQISLDAQCSFAVPVYRNAGTYRETFLATYKQLVPDNSQQQSDTLPSIQMKQIVNKKAWDFL